MWAADRTAQNTKFGEAERTLATRPIVSTAPIPILLLLEMSALSSEKADNDATQLALIVA